MGQSFGTVVKILLGAASSGNWNSEGEPIIKPRQCDMQGRHLNQPLTIVKTSTLNSPV